MIDNKRLTILSKDEITALFEKPNFTKEERDFYFALDEGEYKIMLSFGSILSRMFFILQLGYFKAKQGFFTLDLNSVQEDLSYIARTYFLGKKIFLTETGQRARLNHQAHIGEAITDESKRLSTIVEKNLPESADLTLQKMLVSEGQKMYGITLLKKDAKGFNNKEILQEIKKKVVSFPLFKVAEQIIPRLGISEQNICYYAYLVDYYTVDRLNELPYKTIRIYLLCYIFYRFEKVNDNLVNSFIYHLNSYKKEAKEDGKEKVYEHKTENNQYGEKIAKILGFFTDDSLVDALPFGEVRAKAFRIVEKEEFPLLKHSTTYHLFDEEEFRWEYYKTIAKTISRNLRPLVRAIDFESEDPNFPLMHALTFLKKTFDSKKSLKQIDEEKLPKDFIPASLKPYLYKNEEGRKALNVYQYEFLIYYQLEKALDSGCIFVNNSFNFKNLKKDLHQDWENKQEEVIAALNNPVLSVPIKEQLQDFKQVLNPLLLEVNQRIERGENKEVKIKKGSPTIEWTLAYPKKDKDANNSFYAQIPRVGLNQILRLVNQHCHFMDAFTHVRSRYAKTQADEDSIFACITANATNYGILQMAEISDINYTRLLATSKNFIRLETLKNANDILVNSLSNLPIFKHWNLLENILVSSLDGKKYQTRLRHIMARHSSKYFGQKRGVVSYSMVTNNVCTNTKPIGANDHESHHFFDLVFNNTSDIQPEWHCGDTHSINRVNFALLHLLGQRFTPHIKNISKKACSISSFESPSHYENFLIIPESKINTKPIEEEWGNLQHIFASLLTKHTSQSVVVRKLSSYARSNKTQKALWEYDKILKSLHMLRFIDDPGFRQSIRTALNRGEGYHQLTGKIASVNGSKFRGTTEVELFIWNECSRFVANCIIYYNALLLSKAYEIQEKLGNTKALEFIKKLSPIAWRHINLNGQYEFTNAPTGIDLDRMVATLVFEFEKEQAKD